MALVLVVTLLLCSILDRWHTEMKNIRVPAQAVQGAELQMKYESSSSSDDEQQIPAALDTCIATLLMREMLGRNWSTTTFNMFGINWMTFMMLIMIVMMLLMVMVAITMATVMM